VSVRLFCFPVGIGLEGGRGEVVFAGFQAKKIPNFLCEKIRDQASTPEVLLYKNPVLF
jgi:hypothetical protein